MITILLKYFSKKETTNGSYSARLKGSYLSSNLSSSSLPFNLSEQKLQPPLNQNGHNNLVTQANNVANTNINGTANKSHIITPVRSKSPPSLHSPPMSPINRMPNSSKSPRSRNSLNNIVNNSNKLSNSVSEFLKFYF